MNYTPDWDLPSIPDPPFRAEVRRRRAGRRAIHAGGTREKITKCPLCQAELNAREMHRHYNAVTGRHRGTLPGPRKEKVDA